MGSRGEFQGVKEKILDGFEFKSHIDKAAELNPEDHITHHLLGRFCYEVSQVRNTYYKAEQVLEIIVNEFLKSSIWNIPCCISKTYLPNITQFLLTRLRTNSRQDGCRGIL